MTFRNLHPEDYAEDLAHWYAEGVRDFNDGSVRVVPGIVFHYATPVPIARAWYRGWDTANLAAPVPE